MKKRSLIALLLLMAFLLAGCVGGGTVQPEAPAVAPAPETLGPGVKTYSAYDTDSRFSEGELVVAAGGCYIFPYVLYEFGTDGHFGEGGLYRVDNCFRFTLTDGTEENWLLLSRYDGGDIGEYSLYTRLRQLWLREADACAYTEETQSLLRWPVWVKDGACDVNGAAIDWPGEFRIADERDDPELGALVYLTAAGGTEYWVSRECLVYYSIGDDRG